MAFILLATAFALGLTIGSFLNVVIYRSLHGDSPYRGRSYCDHCKRQLHWFENIPLLSYIVLGGACRTCHKKIPWSYPLVEFVTGLLFLWWASLGFAFFQLTQAPFQVIQPLFWLVIGLLLVIVFFTDLMYGIIPDFSVFLLSLLTIIYRVALTLLGVMQPFDFFGTLASAVCACLFFLLLYLGTKGRGIGFGDVKFAIPMGLILGYPGILVGLFLSFVIGGVTGIVLLIVGKKKFGQTVAFGPFLITGLVISLLYGDLLWKLYWSGEWLLLIANR